MDVSTDSLVILAAIGRLPYVDALKKKVEESSKEANRKMSSVELGALSAFFLQWNAEMTMT